MLIRKAYRFRLVPTAKQSNSFAQSAGSCRFVWNQLLSIQNDLLASGSRLLSYTEACQKLIELKKEYRFLPDSPSQALQQVLKDQVRAFSDCFAKKKGAPRYKKKFRHDSFRLPQGTRLEGRRVFLPKVGWVPFRKSQEVVGKIKNMTVSRSSGKWYVSIQVELEVPEPVHSSQSMVGVDLGVAKLATLSDGTVFQPVNSFRKLHNRLVRAQRKLARKVKFSNKWKMQKQKVQKIHSKIADVRRDYLHKTTTTISKNHAVVIMEDLKVKNMSSSARGTTEEPGRNVRAKAGLNRAILDQGWYEFKRQVEYKQHWNGGRLVLINPARTSQRCSACNHTSASNRIDQARFKCQSCLYEDNADLNAAKNILAAGRAVIASGDIEQDAA